MGPYGTLEGVMGPYGALNGEQIIANMARQTREVI
jgi:hypothetical protein